MHTILIVDDDATNRIIASRALADTYTTATASSGTEALAYLAEHTGECDMILLDLMMPDMDGFQVLERIKQNPDLAQIPVIFLTADTDPETENRCLEAGAVDYIAKPFVMKVLRSRIGRTLELQDLQRNLASMVAEKTARIAHIQRLTVLGMATMVESRDNSTGGHIKRTGEVVRVFAEHLLQRGYLTDKEYVRRIIDAAPMHDLGKIAVDDQILRKNGKLTAEEYAKMKSHPVEGGRVIEEMLRGLRSDEFVDIAVNVARYHHERWDGGGYPDGLAGESIPLESRIMAFADVFDAMASRRYYKSAMPLDQVFSMIEEGFGTQFDPELGPYFLECRQDITRLYTELFEDKG